MPRPFAKDSHAPEVTVPDWTLLERLEELLKPYATGVFTIGAKDERSEYEADSVDALHAAVEGQDEHLESVTIRVTGANGLHAYVAMSSVWHGVMFRARGPEERDVNHISTRVEELVKAARQRFEASSAAQDEDLQEQESGASENESDSAVRGSLHRPARPIRLALSHPVIATVVGGVILLPIAAGIYGWAPFARDADQTPTTSLPSTFLPSTVGGSGALATVTLNAGESKGLFGNALSVYLINAKKRPDGGLVATFGLSGVRLDSAYEWQAASVGSVRDLEGLYRVRLGRVLPDAQRAVIEVQELK